MKKPLPVPVILAVAAVVVIVGWIAFSKASEDPVFTGTKTGYGPNNPPPKPSFTIPPMPEGAGAGKTPPPPK
jgi:hypothetical protein